MEKGTTGESRRRKMILKPVSELFCFLKRRGYEILLRCPLMARDYLLRILKALQALGVCFGFQACERGGALLGCVFRGLQGFLPVFLCSPCCASWAQAFSGSCGFVRVPSPMHIQPHSSHVWLLLDCIPTRTKNNRANPPEEHLQAPLHD